MLIIRQSIVLTLLLALVVCGAYPAAVTVLGRTCWAKQSAGSLLTRNGTVIGSSLIGQPFSGPRYFHGRPSAAGQGYDAQASGGSNLGPTSLALARRMADEANRLRQDNPEAASLPVDLLTASGSGLDPHLSPEAVLFQAPHVARARGLGAQVVTGLVESRIEEPELGFLGQRRINVLELNLALDAMQP
jgi:K+-transporting ATPase ATPase C chain